MRSGSRVIPGDASSVAPSATAGLAARKGGNPPRPERDGPRRRIYVNRRSGVAHESMGCKWMLDVPMGAVRVENVYEWPPKRRLCPTCFPPALPTL